MTIEDRMMLANKISEIVENLKYISDVLINYEDIQHPQIVSSVENRTVITESELTEKIKYTILELGVKPSNLGYRYIVDSVIYLCKLPDAKTRVLVTKEVYPIIARKYNSTASRVERAIRHEIRNVHQKGNINKIEEIFRFWNIERDSLTNSEFLFRLRDFVLR